MDLNLLLALDALIEHESVQGAADATHVTPPAMSHTLKRLRLATGDDVLVRNGRRMEATPRAIEIREEVRDLVVRAREVLSPRADLDLPALERKFVIRGNEALLAALAAPLIHEVALTAPGVTLSLLGEHSSDDQDLARGLADITLGGAHTVGPAMKTHVLGEDRLDLILRADHPLTSLPRIEAEDFAGALHVVVSRRGRLYGPIDGALADHGLHRTVLAAVPTTAMAFDVVHRSDAITVAAGHLVPAAGTLTRRPLPLTLPPLTAVMTWHIRQDNDPAHQWLRRTIAAILSPLLQHHRPRS